MLFPVIGKHAVNGNPTLEPFPEGMQTIMFGETAQSHFSFNQNRPDAVLVCYQTAVNDTFGPSVGGMKHSLQAVFVSRYGLLLGG